MNKRFASLFLFSLHCCISLFSHRALFRYVAPPPTSPACFSFSFRWNFDRYALSTTGFSPAAAFSPLPGDPSMGVVAKRYPSRPLRVILFSWGICNRSRDTSTRYTPFTLPGLEVCTVADAPGCSLKITALFISGWAISWFAITVVVLTACVLRSGASYTIYHFHRRHFLVSFFPDGCASATLMGWNPHNIHLLMRYSLHRT